MSRKIIAVTIFISSLASADFKPAVVKPESNGALNPPSAPSPGVALPNGAYPYVDPAHVNPNTTQSAAPSSGGRNESVSSGGGGGGGGGGAPPIDSLPQSTPVGNAFETKPMSLPPGVDGRAQVMVAGCTNQPGRFQLVYAEAKNPKCADAKMDEALRDFMDRNFSRCVMEGAGSSAPISDGKIFHVGTLGDDRHKHTGSLHNRGLAIDIKAVAFNGKTFTFNNPADKPFFNKFRACWGAAADKDRGGCLTNSKSGRPPASIGEEDGDHRNHMHLSLPFCPQVARRMGVYITLQMLIAVPAFAEEPTRDTERASTFVRKTLSLKNGGEALLTVRDTGGEPVNADQRISLDLKCPGATSAVIKLEDDLGACEFDDVKYDNKKNSITVLYRSAIMRAGALACVKREKKSYSVKCK